MEGGRLLEVPQHCRALTGKVLVVAYGRWSFTRGSPALKSFDWESFGGRLWKVVVY